MRLKDRVAIVTGAGRGIGKAIAVAFVREGAKVVVADIDENLAKKAETEINGKGGEATGISCNVADRQDVEKMVKKCLEKYGRIDILVNNAGIIRPAMIHNMTEEQWDSVIDVHLKGSFNCLQAVVPSMMVQKSGRVINLTSAAGLVGTIGQINYGSAKGGINGFTRSAARELAKYNILVNAIAPGAATRMTEKVRTDEKMSKLYLERIPLGRWAEPEEIAPAAVFFASDEASYITGQILAVDGGMTIR
jgi:3-oxoacyl-[acyl-carrier protein] reductase